MATAPLSPHSPGAASLETVRVDGAPSLNDIEIKKCVRDADLTRLNSTIAYRIDGVHLYADIQTSVILYSHGCRARNLSS